MDEFGVLARDFGFKPQGKSPPMASSKSNIFVVGSDNIDHHDRSSSSSPFIEDHNHDRMLFNDVFGGPLKHTNTNNNKWVFSLSDFDYDSIFKSSSTSLVAKNDSKNKASSSVYDKPVYDEDIFDGLPGFNSKSTSLLMRYDDNVFTSISLLVERNWDDYWMRLSVEVELELELGLGLWLGLEG